MIKLVTGDCREWLARIKNDTVDCCVTSPPYFGLRDYGCNNQIGLEQSPAEYVQKMVEVFRDVRRVLKPDGTLWLNLGDSYASAWVCNRRSQIGLGSLPDGKRENRPNRLVEGLKEKDLIGIPWRVAFALQADGWYLRQDIIWHKPNPMPESVRDRCTKAHEYLFMFSKSQKYHFDCDAIAEPLQRPDEGQRKTPAKFGGANKFTEAKKQSRYHSGNEYLGTSTGTRNRRSVWTVAPKPFKEAHFATFPPDLIRPCILAGCRKGGIVLDPFGGAGTTALVAREEGRKAVLIELNPAYVEIANRRLFPPLQEAAE